MWRQETLFRYVNARRLYITDILGKIKLSINYTNTGKDAHSKLRGKYFYK